MWKTFLSFWIFAAMGTCQLLRKKNLGKSITIPVLVSVLNCRIEYQLYKWVLAPAANKQQPGTIIARSHTQNIPKILTLNKLSQL